MKASAALGALALGSTGLGRRITEQMARYEEYLVLAQTCGVNAERAKAIFEEEEAKPGRFDTWLRQAKERVTSGAA